MPRQETDIFQVEILKQFLRLKTYMEQLITPIVQKYDLTPLGTLVLYAVSEQDNPTISKMYRSMNLNQGNLSSLCKKLEQGGFLTRVRDKGDERMVVLALTENGYQALDGVARELHCYDEVLGRISLEEIQKALNGFKNFVDIIAYIHMQTFQAESESNL